MREPIALRGNLCWLEKPSLIPKSYPGPVRQERRQAVIAWIIESVGSADISPHMCTSYHGWGAFILYFAECTVQENMGRTLHDPTVPFRREILIVCWKICTTQQTNGKMLLFWHRWTGLFSSVWWIIFEKCCSFFCLYAPPQNMGNIFHTPTYTMANCFPLLPIQSIHILYGVFMLFAFSTATLARSLLQLEKGRTTSKCRQAWRSFRKHEETPRTVLQINANHIITLDFISSVTWVSV